MRLALGLGMVRGRAAPLVVLGMLAGESGPGGIRFDDVQSTYLVGAIALALILFDGGLRTRFQIFRSVNQGTSDIPAPCQGAYCN